MSKGTWGDKPRNCILPLSVIKVTKEEKDVIEEVRGYIQTGVPEGVRIHQSDAIRHIFKLGVKAFKNSLKEMEIGRRKA